MQALTALPQSSPTPWPDLKAEAGTGAPSATTCRTTGRALRLRPALLQDLDHRTQERRQALHDHRDSGRVGMDAVGLIERRVHGDIG